MSDIEPALGAPVAASASEADRGPSPPEPVSLQDIADVVQAAVKCAKEGDMYGAEVVRRYWRGRRETVVLDIGNPGTAEEIADAQGKVLALAFGGVITPREGRDFSSMIENRRRALHTLDQQQKLDEMVEFARQHAPGKKVQR